ncbi:conserved protein of unknown function (plasmid) [Cupriavidus taiwanensis]|uniref:Uncharacterized protein n=1 Tax=Cupriavidus taiwanensis TaxID=164546 RepID=A0A9Q7UZ02_9BURK|nr:hypothetical protein [Cupriavidus taiwanensis]SPD68629.1 conserved protein of unknown function [Cupriavidus taiwanensis]
MLRITIEYVPRRKAESPRVIARAEIACTGAGPLCQYRATLEEEPFGQLGQGVVEGYVRFSASVWDLTARAMVAALGWGNALPPLPRVPEVPKRFSLGLEYVRISDIPEPTRTFFARYAAQVTSPAVDEEPDPLNCAYWKDYQDFLAGKAAPIP